MVPRSWPWLCQRTGHLHELSSSGKTKNEARHEPNHRRRRWLERQTNQQPKREGKLTLFNGLRRVSAVRTPGPGEGRGKATWENSGNFRRIKDPAKWGRTTKGSPRRWSRRKQLSWELKRKKRRLYTVPIIPPDWAPRNNTVQTRDFTLLPDVTRQTFWNLFLPFSKNIF